MSFKLTLGKISILDSPSFHNEAIISLYPAKAIFDRFLFKVLPARALAGNSKSAIMGNTLNSESLAALMIPLPPLAEQHRIITKVDELMAQCDKLEAQHNHTAEAHERLVNNLLCTLTQSKNAAEFNSSWKRIAAHFSLLFNTETSIDELKKSLLQLAVMGKLVEQDENDEPADKLIHRLRAARMESLIESSNDSESKTMIRKLERLGKAKAPFPIPSNWTTAHLIDCCLLLVDCHNKTAPYVPSGIPIIRTSNIRDRKFKLDDIKYVSEKTYDFWSRRCPPKEGDIMFTREAPMGEAAIVPRGEKYCLGQRSMLVRPMHSFIFNEYLLLALTEPHLLERSSESAIGSTVKHLRVGDVEELNIPIPPLNEQRRIVAKVNMLMEVCDNLKARITESNQLKQKLANILVNSAVTKK